MLFNIIFNTFAVKYSELKRLLRAGRCIVIRQGSNHEIWHSPFIIRDKVMKEVQVIIGRVNEGNYVYSAVMDAPEVPFGLNGTGRTVQEAKEDMLEAYNEIKEIMEQNGEAYEDLLFHYSYDLSSFLNYYAFALSLAGLERISGINQRQLSHYINGSSKPRKTTVKRFQKRLEAFAKDLLSASILM